MQLKHHLLSRFYPPALPPGILFPLLQLPLLKPDAAAHPAEAYKLRAAILLAGYLQSQLQRYAAFGRWKLQLPRKVATLWPCALLERCAPQQQSACFLPALAPSCLRAWRMELPKWCLSCATAGHLLGALKAWQGFRALR